MKHQEREHQMSLLADLAGLEPRTCPACDWVGARSKQERAEIKSSVESAKRGDVRFTDVLRVLVKHGMPDMNAQAWRHHARNHHVAD
ncbi:hypothetical protein DOROTHY_34 [Mycobacterium phage Dorothy]|uniref:Uncharacterized protein n=3 Tax=Cheoctovirus TaxID=1623281 RepID=J7KM28_9CAUD|nr:hypothetical protein FDG65_gp034 [Mycobacterium phage Dorothy]AFQ97429.1 hypothetical protein DOROTHY_34 [Mycobacterium phage Dorothy]UJE15584.1 membrane protein [Mycobacterium phage Madiba]